MGQMPEDTRPDPGKRKEVTLDPGKMMSQLPATSDRGKLGSSEVLKAILLLFCEKPQRGFK